MIGISMRFKTGIKINHLLAKSCSFYKNFLILFNRAATSCARKGFSHFQHYFGVVLFHSQVWNQKFAHISKKISRHINLICKMVPTNHSVFVKFCNTTTKCIQNPFKNRFAVVRNFKNSVIVGIYIAGTCGFTHVMANEKTSLSINESSKIRQIQSGNFAEIIGFKFRHKNSLVKYHTILNQSFIKVTLNDLTREIVHDDMRKSDHCEYIKAVRESRRTFPAIEIWSVGKAKLKVTECLNEASRLLAQNMAQTIDEVTRDVLASSSSVTLATNGSNGQTPTDLTKEDIDLVVKTLLSNDAEMISEMIDASDGFSTTPIRPAFWGIIDTNLLDDLEAVSNFVPAANYGNTGTVLDGEWGATSNVRWLYTSVGTVSTASPAVYTLPIIGKEAYGVINLRSESGEFYIEPLGSGGSADPLHQRGSVGWSHPFVARILNDSFLNNLLVTHS